MNQPAWVPSEPEQSRIRSFALQNALEYSGKGIVGSTLGRILADSPGLKPHAKELAHYVAQAVSAATTLYVEIGEAELTQELTHLAPDLLAHREHTRKT